MNPPAKQTHGYKNPAVEKVYKASSNNKAEHVPIVEGEEEDGYKKMEMIKMREDRLKKN